jgi:hypothetical protein
LWPLTNPAKPTPAAAKLQRKTLGQLARWLRRAISRRLSVQAAAVKLDSVNTSQFTASQLRYHAFRILALEAHAANLDAFRDLLEEEIKWRHRRILRAGDAAQ